jgi:hypothetical protein
MPKSCPCSSQTWFGRIACPLCESNPVVEIPRTRNERLDAGMLRFLHVHGGRLSDLALREEISGNNPSVLA